MRWIQTSKAYLKLSVYVLLHSKWVFVALVGVTLSSCTNLEPVRQWSAASLDAAQYSEIVSVYVESPERIVPLLNEEVSREKILLQRLKNLEKKRESQEKALKEALSIVADYMKALSTLAAKETVDYSKDIDEAVESLKKLGKFNETELGAAGSILKTVLNLAGKVYQSKIIGDTVEAANAPLQDLISENSSLYDIFDTLQNDLNAEKNVIIKYYGDALLEDQDAGQPLELVKILVAKERLEDLNLIELKKEKIQAYRKSLAAIATGHKKLYESRNDLDAKELVSNLRNSINEIRKQIDVLKQTD